MKGPRSGAARDLAWAVGLALGLLAAMLWWTSGQATRVQAQDTEGAQFPAGSIRDLLDGTVGPAWVSTEPITRMITVGEMSTQLVWAIPQYGVTVTFPAGWLGPLPSQVVLTFTPELSAVLPAPASATSYFYDLRGEYDIPGDGEISVSKPITVDIHYNERGLGSATEGTLRAFWACCSQRSWVPVEARNGSSRVDTASNVFQLTIKSMGHIGVGGYRSQVFAPVVLRSVSTGGGNLSAGALQP